MSININPYAQKRVVGEIPRNEATNSGHIAAVQVHNEFAQENDFRQFKDLSIDYLDHVLVEEEGKTRCHTLFARFASFIIRDDVGKSKKGFAPNSCTQYYSNFKNALADKLPGYAKLREPKDAWYTHLYKIVKISARVRNMERGEAISDGSDSIWRDILISLCLYLVKLNTSEVSTKR